MNLPELKKQTGRLLGCIEMIEKAERYKQGQINLLMLMNNRGYKKDAWEREKNIAMYDAMISRLKIWLIEIKERIELIKQLIP